MKTFWTKFLYCILYTTCQMGCVINLFWKFRGTYSLKELGWRTVANRSCSGFISLKFLSNSEFHIVRGENCHLHYMSAVILSFVSRVWFWLFSEFLRHSTRLLLVSFSRRYSVVVPDSEVRFLLRVTFVILNDLSVLVDAYACFGQFQQ